MWLPCAQRKQREAQPSSFTLPDQRSAEEQAAAAQLSSRLAKLRAEHQGSAAKAALQLGQAAEASKQVLVHACVMW